MARYYCFMLVVHVSICPSGVHPSVLLFLDDNLHKYQWIFTKLGMCSDFVEVWFGITKGQILSIFDRVICPPHDSGRVLSFHIFILIWCWKPGVSQGKGFMLHFR